MSFRDTSLDDSPKSRVQERFPNARCVTVWWGDKRAGYIVSLDAKVLGSATTAYEAWRSAEAKLSEQAPSEKEKL